MLETFAIATSMASQLNAIRQEEPDNAVSPQRYEEWIRFIVIVAAAAMHVKAQMLWSEARMLRKLKARHPNHLRDSLRSENSDHAFVELYLSLSKGRHRTYSRWYGFFYYVFTISLDVVDTIVSNLSNSSQSVTSSGELTTLRLLIYFGSFSTFGAVKLSLAHYAFMMLSAATITSFRITTGYGWLRVSLAPAITWVGLGFVYTSTAIFFLLYVKNLVFWPGYLADIVSVMASTREKNFGNPNLEHVDLRGNLKPASKKRLELMEGISGQYKTFDEIQSRQVIPRDWHAIAEMSFYYVVVTLMTSLFGYELSNDAVPRTAILEFLEAISVFLLYINETTIENVLFVKLLQVANIPRDGLSEQDSESIYTNDYDNDV